LIETGINQHCNCQSTIRNQQSKLSQTMSAEQVAGPCGTSHAATGAFARQSEAEGERYRH
jgi:hypothetical protein